VIAAGAIRTCAVPIRTVVTSVSITTFPWTAPIGGNAVLLHAITAIKF
jgi:hypothetical protein